MVECRECKINYSKDKLVKLGSRYYCPKGHYVLWDDKHWEIVIENE